MHIHKFFLDWNKLFLGAYQPKNMYLNGKAIELIKYFVCYLQHGLRLRKIEGMKRLTKCMWASEANSGYLSLYTLLVQSPYSVSQQPVTLALSHTIYWSADLIDRFQGQLGTSPQY